MSTRSEEQESRDQLFAVRLKELLDDEKCDEATQHFGEGLADGTVGRTLWESVPMLAARLTGADKICHRSVFFACEKLLKDVTEKCNPKETLLLLLEALKSSEDETTFRCVLKLLGASVIRAGPARVFDWCVQSIKNYIRTLTQPENKKPRDAEANDEEPAMNEDPIVERLTMDYEAILEFLEPIVEYAVSEDTRETKTKNYLLGLHLFLFGTPFCYLDHRSPKTNSLFLRAMSQMSKLTGNFFKFLRIVELRSRERSKKPMVNGDEDDSEEANESELFRGEISNLAYGNFYYYVLNSEEGRNNTPLVYDPLFLSRECFYLANVLLREPEYILVSKGLKIIEAILSKIEISSISHEYLELAIHRSLFASLSQVMIYCDADQDRKLALGLFRSYIDRFDIRARYLIVLHLYETSNHSGLLGLLTNIAKSSIIQCLEEVPKCEYFLGRKLQRLLKKICRLANGSASDLVEISDEVIAALNLLRFLTIRDRDDSTGVWGIIDTLETNYLKPLREGIDLARAHWKVKVRDLEEQKIKIEKKETGASNEDITVSVGGQQLPMMPDTEKIGFCYQALNALDVMESILIRVNECIAESLSRTSETRREI